MNHATSICLFAAALLLCVVPLRPAMADIYLYQSEEVRLSNLEEDTARETLIIEKAHAFPAPAANIALKPASTTSALPFDAAVQAAAIRSDLEPALLHAVIAAESGHNPRAVSPKGAQGLMQLMPATSRRLLVDNPWDPMQNVLAGARYLRELRDLYRGDIELALAAYNAGPGAVSRSGNRIPQIAETRRYVPQVLAYYRNIAGK